jgi:hypothetical protein
MVIVRQMIRWVQLCKDGRRREVSHAKILFIGGIPALTYDDFEGWFKAKFNPQHGTRWSIIRMGKRSRKPHRVALFNVWRGNLIGDCSRLKRTLTWKQKGVNG